MNKKTIIWIVLAGIAVLFLGVGGFVGYRIFNRRQGGFPGGPGRGFGDQFLGEGERGFGDRFLGDGARAFGAVTAFDEGTLTIIDQDGEELSFSISGDTQFFSPDSSLNEFQDLEVGLEISVIYETLADDELRALTIGIGQGPGGPGRGFGDQFLGEGEGGFGDRFLGEGERAFGEVTSIDEGSLTIIDQGGEELSFSISGDTQFFSPDSSLNELQDLEVGLEVFVIYETLADDELRALTIGIGQGPGGFRNPDN